MKNYRAFRVHTDDNTDTTTVTRSIETLPLSQLPDHDLLVRVHYSSLNYKDALSASGNRSVTRSYPRTPGIDAAGVVEASSDSRFTPGQPVIVTSYDLGMDTDGGFGEYIRVPGNWVVPLPEGLSLYEAMQFGTAGFTAALAVHKLEAHGKSADSGKVVVTGATGGVGSIAIALLSDRGYEVVAATGKSDAHAYLTELGASEIIDRAELQQASSRPLLSGRWMGAVDTVGGVMLDTVIRSTHHEGVVTCCGNAASHELSTNVYPFILRGISLLGIDSGICPMPTRKMIWGKLADPYKTSKIDLITETVDLDALDREIDLILEGGQVGRKVVRVAAE